MFTFYTIFYWKSKNLFVHFKYKYKASTLLINKNTHIFALGAGSHSTQNEENRIFSFDFFFKSSIQ